MPLHIACFLTLKYAVKVAPHYSLDRITLRHATAFNKITIRMWLISFHYFVFAHGTRIKCRVRTYWCVRCWKKVELSQVLFLNCQLGHHASNLKPLKDFPSSFCPPLVLNLFLPMMYFKKRKFGWMWNMILLQFGNRMVKWKHKNL